MWWTRSLCAWWLLGMCRGAGPGPKASPIPGTKNDAGVAGKGGVVDLGPERRQLTACHPILGVQQDKAMEGLARLVTVGATIVGRRPALLPVIAAAEAIRSGTSDERDLRDQPGLGI